MSTGFVTRCLPDAFPLFCFYCSESRDIWIGWLVNYLGERDGLDASTTSGNRSTACPRTRGRDGRARSLYRNTVDEGHFPNPSNPVLREHRRRQRGGEHRRDARERASSRPRNARLRGPTDVPPTVDRLGSTPAPSPDTLLQTQLHRAHSRAVDGRTRHRDRLKRGLPTGLVWNPTVPASFERNS